MKIIYPERIFIVAADEENASYPDDNVLDNHPKKVWKATSKDAQMKLTCSGGTNAVALFNVTADTITITVLNETETETLVAAQQFDLKGTDTYLEFIQDRGENWTQLWYDYEYQPDPVVVIIDFEAAAAEIVEAGVIRCGLAIDFHDPSVTLQEGLKDYSIVKELNNGALYIRKRDVVRTFAGTVTLERDREFYFLIRDIIQKVGAQPLAWRITDLDNYDWAVFAKADKMPSGAHNRPSHTDIKLNLLEVI